MSRFILLGKSFPEPNTFDLRSTVSKYLGALHYCAFTICMSSIVIKWLLISYKQPLSPKLLKVIFILSLMFTPQW